MGDEVFCDNFERFGGFAELVCVPAGKLVRKPKSISHELAAAIPQSGVIAMQGLRKYGDVQPGQRVLINGATMIDRIRKSVMLWLRLNRSSLAASLLISGRRVVRT